VTTCINRAAFTQCTSFSEIGTNVKYYSSDGTKGIAVFMMLPLTAQFWPINKIKNNYYILKL